MMRFNVFILLLIFFSCKSPKSKERIENSNEISYKEPTPTKSIFLEEENSVGKLELKWGVYGASIIRVDSCQYVMAWQYESIALVHHADCDNPNHK